MEIKCTIHSKKEEKSMKKSFFRAIKKWSKREEIIMMSKCLALKYLFCATKK